MFKTKWDPISPHGELAFAGTCFCLCVTNSNLLYNNNYMNHIRCPNSIMEVFSNFGFFIENLQILLKIFKSCTTFFTLSNDPKLRRRGFFDAEADRNDKKNLATNTLNRFFILNLTCFIADCFGGSRRARL